MQNPMEHNPTIGRAASAVLDRFLMLIGWLSCSEEGKGLTFLKGPITFCLCSLMTEFLRHKGYENVVL